MNDRAKSQAAPSGVSWPPGKPSAATLSFGLSVLSAAMLQTATDMTKSSAANVFIPLQFECACCGLTSPGHSCRRFDEAQALPQPFIFWAPDPVAAALTPAIGQSAPTSQSAPRQHRTTQASRENNSCGTRSRL